MIDYFALLGQPRRPWLNLAKLEEKYRERARATHPDEAPAQNASGFAEINQAYRVLRDPKSRLQHLLTIEGRPPSASASNIAAELVDLFMEIAPVLKTAEGKEVDALLDRLHMFYDQALEQLRVLNEQWNERQAWTDLERLYQRLSFLTRWRNIVEERRFSITANQ